MRKNFKVTLINEKWATLFFILYDELWNSHVQMKNQDQ